MRIKWHGHSCFEIESEEVTLVTDPHDVKSVGLPVTRLKADIILVSHDHFDHNCSRIVKSKRLAASPKIVVGEQKTRIKGVQIKGVAAYHDRVKGERRGGITIYKWEMDGIKFSHLSDLGHLLSEKTVKKLGEIDILFTPIGSVFTIDANDAWNVIGDLKPKVIIPMHYKTGGLTLGIETADKFLKIAQSKEVEIRNIGKAIDFDVEDIPDVNEVWLFSI